MTIEAMKQALEALLRSREAVKGDYDLASCAYGSVDPDGHRYQDAKKAVNCVKAAITALRTAIAEAEKQEPHRLTSWGFCSVCKHDKIPGEGCARKDCPEAPAAQRQPLTDKQIGKILDDPNIAEAHQGNWLVLPYAFARAIEAAHGITGEKPDAA